MSYNEIKAMRWSVLKAGTVSPLALQHALANPSTDSAAKGLGRAAHLTTLLNEDPPQVPDEHLTPSGALSTSAKTKAWIAENAGQEFYSAADIATAWAIRDAVLAHDEAAATLDACPIREVGVTGEVDGVPAKCKPDAIGATMLCDLKTTSATLDTRSLAREILRWGYHGQMAWYRKVCGRDDLEVRLIFVQSKAPHDVAVVPLGEEWMALGDELVSRALGSLARLRAAEESGVRAPGIAPGLLAVDVPRWLQEDEDTAEGLEGLND